LKNRESLWNAVERCEKRKDATLAREIEVALPIELTLAQQNELIREYINNEFISLGMIADFSIHDNHDSDKKNPHAHIMLTLRPITEKGFGQKDRSWNDLKLFEKWREQWAVVTNKHLSLNGIDKRIDHRSYAEQGIDLEPTIHKGYQEQKQDESLDRVKKSQEIKERNYERLFKDPQIALELLTYYQSVFSHEDLAKFVHARTNTIDEFTRLKLVIETHQALVDLGQGLDGKRYYTSKQVLEREQELLNNCDKLSKSTCHSLSQKEISKVSFVLKDKNLNCEQFNAFNHILSGSSLSLMVGYAGTGKSYLLNAVREVYEAKGYRVVGTALSGRASDGLLQSANINSRTIARFLIDWDNERYKLDDKTILVIDEIGMVGTRQIELLIKEAMKVGAKVIGCGDPEQIPPIEAGCPFRLMLERYPHVKLENVVRQKIDWQRQATIELSTRRHIKALDRYQEHGFIYEHETRDKAIDAIVENWHHYYQKQYEDDKKKIREEGKIKYAEGKIAVMMAYRNSDVLALNLKGREKLIAHHKINTKQSLTINTEKFGQLNFALNDRIMFLKNDNDIGVKNGLMGKVIGIGNDILDDNLHRRLDNNLHNYLTIQMDRGDIVSFSPLNYPHISYAYASTVHKL
jgi:Ti-type conjugative transfer relaxase TraA